MACFVDTFHFFVKNVYFFGKLEQTFFRGVGFFAIVFV